MKANVGAKLKDNNNANIEMITMGIVAAVMFAIAVPIIFNVVGSFDMKTADTTIKQSVYGWSSGTDHTEEGNQSYTEWNATKPSGNATASLLTQVNSFFSIGPIYLVVIVAVGIIAAILVLRRFGGM